jgi:G3E family GTPase
MTWLIGLFSWFTKGGWKWLIGLIFALVLAYGLNFARNFYNDYQDLLAQQIENAEIIGELTTVNQTNEATITELERQAREAELNRQVLEISMRNAETRVNELESLLSRHDLEFLASERPGLIERRINDATENVFRTIECITDPSCVQSERTGN